MKKYIILFFFITGLNAGVTTLEKVTNMLSIFTLAPSIKEQLAKNIATDIEVKESTKGSKFSSFIDKEGGEEDYYYLAAYYKKENGEIEFEGDIRHTLRSRAIHQRKIVLQKLDRPLNFDFSSLSDDEIVNSFTKEWSDIHIDSAVKNILSPLLTKDLISKIRAGKHRREEIPGFIKGGDGTYNVTYHIDENSMATIDTFFLASSPDETRYLELSKIKKPINFNWGGLKQEDIKAAVRPILEKKIPVIGEKIISDLEPSIVQDLYHRAQDAEQSAGDEGMQASVKMPYFLGGDTGYTVEFYRGGSGNAKANGFAAGRPSYDGDRETIVFIELRGRRRFKYLSEEITQKNDN